MKLNASRARAPNVGGHFSLLPCRNKIYVGQVFIWSLPGVEGKVACHRVPLQSNKSGEPDSLTKKAGSTRRWGVGLEVRICTTRCGDGP